MAWNMTKFHAAPVGARQLDVHDQNGTRVGIVPLGRMKPPDRTKLLYSFGLLSDIHLGKNDDANKAFAKTIDYMDADDDVEFICITGDLNHNSTATRWDLFQEKIECRTGVAVTKKGGKKVYAVSGNHEPIGTIGTDVMKYTGIGTYDVAEHGGDVFILLGCYGYVHNYTDADGYFHSNYQGYLKDDLVAIHDEIARQKDKGKRIFIMQHVPVKKEHKDFDVNTIQNKFYLPRSVYKGTSVFYGHEHKNLSMTTASHKNLCRDDLGFNGVFVPALCGVDEAPAGHGYIVDVYPDGIHLRGMDFVKGAVMPLGTFWIDTK